MGRNNTNTNKLINVYRLHNTEKYNLISKISVNEIVFYLYEVGVIKFRYKWKRKVSIEFLLFDLIS